MEVTINLPEDVAQVFLKNGESIEREVLEATAHEGTAKFVRIYARTKLESLHSPRRQAL